MYLKLISIAAVTALLTGCLAGPMPIYTPEITPAPNATIHDYRRTTYNRVGNTLIGTDGSFCQTVGLSTVCRN